MTIESYLIELKIERVKELLSFNKWTLSEIAWKLKYSSVQYLSNQFKKVTGSTVTEYLKEKSIPRKSLDQI
jgi:AraC family transcriptional regulator